MLDPSIFRAYDIRGRAGSQLSTEVAHLVGCALGTRIRRAGGREASVGQDVRHSSPDLARAVTEGFAETGLTVHDLGVVPTPVLYHSIYRLGLGGGVMVTGSHNPREDNGLKLCLGTDSVWGEDVASLRTQALARDFEHGKGRVIRNPHLEAYLNEMVSSFHFAPGLRVGVDCGNGVMGPVVLRVFEKLGIEVEPLYCEPDGDFPNHIPDPEVPAYMAKLGELVRERGLSCGLGFDGDGDRVGVLDENGRKISADWLIVLFARSMLQRYPGGKVRFDVKCSDFLFDEIRAAGGEPVMGETGHSLLKRDVKAMDAIMGGELSGHIVFHREVLPIDDSLLCALRFLDLLQRSSGSASDLFEGFPELVSTAEIKVPCPDDHKFLVVEALVESFRERFEVESMDGARVRVPGGWFLVRASNTTPNLTVRFEAETREQLLAARDILSAALARFESVDAAILGEV